MDKAIDSVEGARRLMGLRLQGASELNGVRQCHHEGPPTESRPCEGQTRAAIQRADRAWRRGPRRIKGLCGELPNRAGGPAGGSAQVEAPDGGSEFSPGPSDSGSGTECFESCDPGSSDSEWDSEPPEAESEGFGPPEAEPEGSGLSGSEPSETESEESDSSEAESEDSNPFDMEARRRGPLTSDSSDSGSSSSSSDSEESDSCSADSGFAKPSSSDTEGDLTPSAPPLEEIEEFGRKVIGLSGRARRQVRKLLAMLARMRKDLPFSARTEAVRRLGWHLGPSREVSGASVDDSGPEPTQAPGGGDQIRKYLEEWRQKYKEGEERYRAEREEAARSDDGLACALERLTAERAAELEKRAKVIEQQLPVITAQLGILWGEVTGSSRPMPSEIQLTSTGTEMTTEEHMATAETHLRYAEGHLQPSEEHLADAVVHLKLVKAHLAALVAIEQGPPEAATLPLPEPAGGEASAGRAKMTPEERDRSPAARSRVRSVQRGSEPGSKTFRLGAGEDWTCPVGKCQDSATHPLDECGEFRGLSVTQRRKAIRECDRCECCLTDCRDRKTGSRCYRQIGFRRHHLLRLVSQTRMNQARDGGRRQLLPQGEISQTGRNIPRGKPGQTSGVRSRGQEAPPQRQTEMWCFPAVSKDRELVWLRAPGVST
jgi:hypothetical protein